MQPETRVKSRGQAYNTLCTVYSAGINRGYSYPYRMVPAHRVTSTHRGLTDTLMVDSVYNNDSITNEDVLEAARKVDADFVIPKDYPGRPHESVEMMEQFLDLYDPRTDHFKPYMVVQPPLAETFKEYEDFYSRFGRLAIGGLKDKSPETQTDEVYEFYEALRASSQIDVSSVDVHGFGLGLSPEMVHFIRTYPHALDSLDVSTPEISIKNNKLPDALWVQTPMALPGGDNRRDLQARYAEATLYLMNYLLSDVVNEEELHEMYGLLEDLPDAGGDEADDGSATTPEGTAPADD